MILGCIADDFTGAGDLANTLSNGGMHTRLYVGTDRPAEECEAGVVALKTRSISSADAVGQSIAALHWLLAAGCQQIIFKYCSTFDSTAKGNIGPVAEALAEALHVRGVIVCPAFPGTGRTVYQGHLFVGDRLLSESGMERHPLTPMVDSDIRRWLGSQSQVEPAHIALPIVREGPEVLRKALQKNSATLVVVDAITNDDLQTIGKAAAEAPLITGGSGVAMALPDNFREAGLIGRSRSGFRGQSAPALVLAGSCSAATLDQVAHYRSLHPSFEINVTDVMAGPQVIEHIRAFLQDHENSAPLIFSSAAPERVRSAQAAHGSARSAAAVEALFSAIAREAVSAGFGRIVVAGGETSGAVVTALGLTSLEIGPEIDAGIPALTSQTQSGHKIALALKSGNFGAPDFLAKAVTMLEMGSA